MRYVLFKKCLAVLSVLVLTVTGLWAAGEEEGSTARCRGRQEVCEVDPTTGKRARTARSELGASNTAGQCATAGVGEGSAVRQALPGLARMRRVIP